MDTPLHQGSESETSATLQTEKLSDGPALVVDETLKSNCRKRVLVSGMLCLRLRVQKGAFNLSSELLSQAGGWRYDGQLKGKMSLSCPGSLVSLTVSPVSLGGVVEPVDWRKNSQELKKVNRLRT